MAYNKEETSQTNWPRIAPSPEEPNLQSLSGKITCSIRAEEKHHTGKNKIVAQCTWGVVAESRIQRVWFPVGGKIEKKEAGWTGVAQTRTCSAGNSDFSHKGVSASPAPSLSVWSTYAVFVTNFPSIPVNPEFTCCFVCWKEKVLFYERKYCPVFRAFISTEVMKILAFWLNFSFSKKRCWCLKLVESVIEYFWIFEKYHFSKVS